MHMPLKVYVSQMKDVTLRILQLRIMREMGLTEENWRNKETCDKIRV